jgi:hypothetical protein
MKQLARSRLMGKGIGERNYHTCLGAVLHSFIERQSLSKVENGGLKAWRRIGDHVKAVNLAVPLYFVIGDAKSGDMLCGRFGGYNTQRIIGRVMYPKINATIQTINAVGRIHNTLSIYARRLPFCLPKQDTTKTQLP